MSADDGEEMADSVVQSALSPGLLAYCMLAFQAHSAWPSLYRSVQFGHRWGRNGEFCVVVDPATWTADTLAFYVLT